MIGCLRKSRRCFCACSSPLRSAPSGPQPPAKRIMSYRILTPRWTGIHGKRIRPSSTATPTQATPTRPFTNAAKVISHLSVIILLISCDLHKHANFYFAHLTHPKSGSHIRGGFYKYHMAQTLLDPDQLFQYGNHDPRNR